MGGEKPVILNFRYVDGRDKETWEWDGTVGQEVWYTVKATNFKTWQEFLDTVVQPKPK